MTNLERLTKTMNGTSVDRVMTYDLLDNQEILKKYGGWRDDKPIDFDTLVETNAKALAGIGVDVTRGVYDPVNHWMRGKIDNWIRFLGVDPADWIVEQGGGTAWIAKRPFVSFDDVKNHMPSMPEPQAVEDWYGPYIESVSKIFSSHDVVMIGGIEGPICDAYTYTEMDQFMMGMYDDPDLIDRLLDITCEYSRIIVDVFSRRGAAPVQFMGEDSAFKSGPIFSPDFLRDKALPRWRKLMAPIHEKGGWFLFHTDGRYGSLLPLILDELGADGLNPIERNGCNDIFDIYKQYPDVVFFGNVCCETTLPFGNTFDVEDEVLELLELIPGTGGRILIGSSSEIHDEVPIENSETMYRTVHEYGAFPIDIDRIRKRRFEISRKLEVRRV